MKKYIFFETKKTNMNIRNFSHEELIENKGVLHLYINTMFSWVKSCLILKSYNEAERAEKPPTDPNTIRKSNVNFEEVCVSFFTDFPLLFSPGAKELLFVDLFIVTCEVFPEIADVVYDEDQVIDGSSTEGHRFDVLEVNPTKIYRF